MEEEQLVQAVETLTERKSTLPQEIEKIKNENRRLKEELAVKLRNKTETIRENDRLAKETRQLATSKERVPSDLAREKRTLEAKVARQEKELDAVKQSITKSTNILDQKRELMDEIMRLDAENESLRNKIAELVERSIRLKDEVSVLEAAQP